MEDRNTECSRPKVTRQCCAINGTYPAPQAGPFCPAQLSAKPGSVHEGWKGTTVTPSSECTFAFPL